MKKLTLLFFVLLTVALKATNYTSVANGNWSSSSTWSPTGVPGATDTATIANTVTLNANESIFTIIINSGSTLTVTSSNTLTVDGSFTNNGTFTPSTGIVNFDGTGAQSLGGSTATTFYELEEYGSGTVTLGNNITVTYYCYLEGGTFDVSTSNYSLSLNGQYDYFYNTFTPRNGTVTFGYLTTTANLFIGSSSTINFYNVVINSTLNGNNGTIYINNLTVNSGKTFYTHVASINYITNNGTCTALVGTFITGTGTALSGSGTFNGNYAFSGTPVTIGAGVTITGLVQLGVGSLGHGIVITNLGTLTNGIASDYGSFVGIHSTLINGATGSVTAPFTPGYGILAPNDTVDATTPGNSITYNGGTYAGTVRIFKNNTVYNLTADLTSLTLSMGSNLTVANNLTISAGTLDATTSNYNLTVDGNFINNGTFTPRSATVTFNGSANQSISGSTATTFNNLTQNQSTTTDTLVLAKAITVNNNLTQTEGVLNSATYQITGNGTGTYSMASGTSLLLGSKSSTTNVSFPTSFTTGNCSLNANSNVVYQANTTSQSISVTPTYGNLVISAGSSLTKTPSGTPLAIGGTLTVNSPATLSETTNTINLTGNATIGGALSFSSGALNIGGSFTNNGTFTGGTSTVTFNGGNDKSINNTSGTLSFYNLTQNLIASADTLFLNNPITISNTATQIQGVLNCQRNLVTNSSFPTVSVTQTAGTICTGNTDTLRASGYSVYVWSPTTGLSASTGATVIATPMTNTIYTVYAGSNSEYTCSQSKDTVNVSSVTTSCSSAIALASGALHADYSFASCEEARWFSFVADSARMLIEITRPVLATDTSMVYIDSLILYSGSCSSLSRFGIAVNNHVYSNDSLPTIQKFNLIPGNTYYIKVTRYSTRWSPNPTYFGLLKKVYHNAVIPTCTVSACAKELLANPDFENAPSWLSTSPYGSGISYMAYSYKYPAIALTSGEPPFSYQDSIRSPNMRYNIGSFGGTWSTCLKDYDETDEYMIASYIGNPYYFYNNPESGTYFMAVDCPSDNCIECTVGPPCSTNNIVTNIHIPGYADTAYTCIPWEQTVKVIPKATYIFSAWIHDLDLSDKEGPAATVYMSINNATPFFQDLIDSSGYHNWVNVCYNWTAPANVDTANIVVFGQGTFDPDGSDFALDNFSFKLAAIPGITANSTTICSNDTAVLQINPIDTGTIYTWSPSISLNTSTGSKVIATPYSTTTYTVTAIFGTCTYSTTCTVTVNTNCCMANCTATANTTIYSGGLSILPGTFSNTLGSSPLTISSTCAKSSTDIGVSINGIFTVSSSKCILDSCNIAMGKYAQIVVDSLDTLIINKARLYACDTMWNGILVKQGGTLIVDSNSIIEDAEIAIEGKTSHTGISIIKVSNSILNNNYIDIKIDSNTASSAYPLTLHNATFTTSTDPFSPNAYLKPPYMGDSTFIGVYIDSVKGHTFGKEAITIGDPSSPSYLNHFSNMEYGVFARNSNFAVFNNNFSTLKGYLNFVGIPSGVGVFADGIDYDTTSLSTFYTAIVGSSGASYNNTFTNCFRGVDVTDYVRLQVDSNQMTCTANLANGISGYGDHAVFFKTEGHDSIQFTLDHNTIQNFSTGIHVLGILPAEFTNVYAKPVHSFINSNNIYANSSGKLGTGILAENLYQNNFGLSLVFFYIQNNVIDSADYCIELNSLSNLVTIVSENPKLHVLPSVSTDNTSKAGIYITNSNSISIDNNPEILATGTYINATAAAADTDVVGINLNLSTDNEICSNTLYALGQDMKFKGDCHFTLTTNNSMDTSYDGFILDMNGVVGTQMAYPSNPVGDTWADTSHFKRAQTYASSSIASSSPFYLLSSAFPIKNKSNDLPLNTYSYSSPGALNNATGATPGCSFSGIQQPSLLRKAIGNTGVDTTMLVNEMKLIIQDSLGGGYTPESQYMMKQTVYRKLYINPNLRIKDTSLQSFYTRAGKGNIGAVYAMEDAIKHGNFVQAQSINGSLVAVNTIEQNYKQIADIYINTYGVRIKTLTAGQLSALQGVANQCPATGGRVVFEARAMLNGYLNTNIMYNDNCTGEQQQSHVVVKQPAINNVTAKVYPNPANSLLNIQVELSQKETGSFCLYNAVGQRVECIDILNGISTLSISNLTSGLYYYRVTDGNGNSIKADKIMIVH